MKNEVLVWIKLFISPPNDDLPSLRKRLRQDYTQFLIDYYELQEDPVCLFVCLVLNDASTLVGH